jgi:hypothetical protein
MEMKLKMWRTGRVRMTTFDPAGVGHHREWSGPGPPHQRSAAMCDGIGRREEWCHEGDEDRVVAASQWCTASAGDSRSPDWQKVPLTAFSEVFLRITPDACALSGLSKSFQAETQTKLLSTNMIEGSSKSLVQP